MSKTPFIGIYTRIHARATYNVAHIKFPVSTHDLTHAICPIFHSPLVRVVLSNDTHTNTDRQTDSCVPHTHTHTHPLEHTNTHTHVLAHTYIQRHTYTHKHTIFHTHTHTIISPQHSTQRGHADAYLKLVKKTAWRHTHTYVHKVW